ncbi:Holliday junction resolvase RecU [Bacillus sp. FJAT-45350]|uniref:Holliday junction resolvase RecU n=1 Tax=Bacillus sp. FJAT-45350 TaxID=2011014 RepID=UPI000BB6A33F|nr:Holliday junction resolvase RecU [Bacillus sp. FJAT-45350]
MPVRYPNGKKFVPKSTTNKKKPTKPLSYSNRGMSLEESINESNEFYLSRGMAVIHKKPTPVQIVQVNYPKRSAAVIKEAYFKQPSTTDYNGVYKGKHIDFEAKESRNKTSFPLKNFHDHQVEHMKNVLQHDGICFVLLSFSNNQEVYLLDASHIIDCYERQHIDRKSIPRSIIEDCGYLVETGFHPRIDYLKIVDQVYF